MSNQKEIYENTQSEEETDEPKTLTLKLSNSKPNEELKSDFNCLKILKIISFYFVGISCFVPYNAILSGLDCFILYHKDYSPEFVYSNLFFFSNFFIQLLIILVSPKYNYYNLIQLSLTISILVLIINPLIIQYCEDYTSFIVTCILTVIQGSASAILFTCLYTFLIYLDPTYITGVVTGHGFGGIIMNISRLITYYAYDMQDDEQSDKEKTLKSFFVFYYVAAFFVLINVFIWLQLKNQIDVRKALRRVHPTLVMFDEEVDYEERCLSLYSIKSEENTSINNKNEIKTSEFSKIKEVLGLQTGINVLVFVHGMISFCLYPGILLKNKLFTTNTSLSILLIFFIFNIFDVMGRQFPRFFKLKSFNAILTWALIRIYFFILFPLIPYLRANNIDAFPFLFNDIFIFINLATFGFSNGFLISNSFIYLYTNEIIREELKSKSSPVLSVSLNTGIYVGSTLAYLLNYLISQ